MKVGVLMGGWSPEKEISRMSGWNVVLGLKEAGCQVVRIELTASDKNPKRLKKRLVASRADVFFIALHGGFGEDGSLQALLDQWGMAYTGSGALACGLAMHKGCSKLVFEAKKIPTASWQALQAPLKMKTAAKEIEISLPLVVKPADVGSSIGFSIVRQSSGLAPALKKAFRFSRWAVVEKYITGVEVTAAVLGKRALPVIEIAPKNEYYDFDAKYTPGKSDHIIPARISAGAAKKVKALAVKAGEALGCRDFYRVDFIVPKKGEPQILEVNTVPGMTSTSLFPEAAKAGGISFPKLLKTLAEMGMNKK